MFFDFSHITNFYFNKLDTGFTGAILEDFLIWKKNKKSKLFPINYNYKKKYQDNLEILKL